MLFFGLVGCDREEEIRSYRAPKDEIPVLAMQTGPATAPSDGSASTQPTEAGRAAGEQESRWTVPQGWVEGSSGGMRYASFKTSSDANAAEVVITRLRGSFGEPLPNINRWRGMVELPPVKDAKEQPVETIDINGREASVYDMTGPKDKRLRLLLVTAGDTVWFFRMIGPADVVAQQKSALQSFVQSVQFEQIK
jgi:hypothetical protein